MFASSGILHRASTENLSLKRALMDQSLHHCNLNTILNISENEIISMLLLLCDFYSCMNPKSFWQKFSLTCYEPRRWKTVLPPWVDQTFRFRGGDLLISPSLLKSYSKHWGDKKVLKTPKISVKSFWYFYYTATELQVLHFKIGVFNFLSIRSVGIWESKSGGLVIFCYINKFLNYFN